MPKAIALYSGGLDSTLAILVMQRMGVEVIPVTFVTEFGCALSRRSGGRMQGATPEELGFTVEARNIGDQFIQLIKNPKFGFGKNMNPCIDCKSLMLREAKRIMDERDADFLITGEVLGQRPMSQRRDTFPKIEKDAGVAGLVLRPLSAKLLRPTVAEERGLVDREKLYAISGRSRKPQIALAEELGLTAYPQPAGGCLLTDPIFSFNLRDLLDHTPNPSRKEIQLLRLGRHFRTGDGHKIIVGRDERDNDAIEALADEGDYLMYVGDGVGSPVVLAEPGIPDASRRLAAELCVRYSSSRKMSSASVTIRHEGITSSMDAAPADDSITERLRIHPPEKENRDE
jgi:hypothetical protein